MLERGRRGNEKNFTVQKKVVNRDSRHQASGNYLLGFGQATALGQVRE